ncbi:phage tail protein [Anaerovorax odorimutans]
MQNVVDVTFPKMTEQVNAFAQSAAGSFGLSETMAKRFTGTFGAMSKAFGFSEEEAYSMSTALTGLAGDVASFYNISQDEAYTKLKSVFTGETETLKDLGIVMTQNALDAYAMANGFGRTTQAMSEAEKVALRYQFVMDQLSLAQGDFARTSDSWANQTRILKLQFDSIKATLGQGFINLFTPILKAINTLLGKLATLANAFKSFTELITGKKSTATAASGMGDVAAAADEASSGVGSVGDAAKSTAKKTKEATKALMGFDSINKLSKEDTGSSSGGGSGGAGVDYGSLATGDNVLDQTDKKMSALMERFKELAALFAIGFKIGAGDLSVIDTIKKNLQDIKSRLVDIFTNKRVTGAANTFFNSFAYNLGRVAGSFVSIGLTIADNLTGGFARYLEQSKKYIQDRIVGIFDASTRITQLTGNYYTALADVFTMFRSKEAKQITADIISVFSDGFIGVIDLALKVGGDVVNVVTAPFVRNTGKIKTALHNTLKPISQVTSTISEFVKDTFESIFAAYDKYIRPAFDKIANGFTTIFGGMLDGYNKYLAPVLSKIAKEFGEVKDKYIQPFVDKLIDVFGKLAELVATVWEKISPFVAWLVEHFFAVVASKVSSIWTVVKTAVSMIAGVLNGLLTTLGGIIDFVTGVLTGDWSKAWNGIKDIFGGVVQAIKGIFEPIADWFKEKVAAIKAHFENIGAWFGEKFSAAWEAIKVPFSAIGSWFSEKYTAIKNVFDSVGSWFSEKFKGAYTAVKNAFSSIGSWFSDKWTAIKNVFSNIKTWFGDKFKSAWEAVKKPFEKVGSFFGGIWDTIKSKFKSIGTKIGDAIGGAFKSAINAVLRTVEKGINWVPRTINKALGLINDLPGVEIPYMPTISLPRLAQGGYVKANTPQLAMIGDNRHQGEVVAPEDKLRQMAMDAVKAAGVGGGITKADLKELLDNMTMILVATLESIGINVDSEEVAKLVDKGRRSMNRRYSPVGE